MNKSNRYRIKLTAILFFSFLVFIPNIANAVFCSSPPVPRDFADIICIFADLINTTLPVLGGIALFMFIFGLTKFIAQAGNEKGREEGKKIMLWGIIALFVFVSIFGIIRVLRITFFSSSSSSLNVPRLPI